MSFSVLQSTKKNDTLGLFLASGGHNTIRSVARVLGAAALFFLALSSFQLGHLNFSASMPLLAQMIVVLVLLHTGHARSAVAVFLWGLAIIPLTMAAFTTGLSAPTLFLLPVVTMASTWLLGKREGTRLLVFVCCGLAGLGVLQSKGMVAPLIVLAPIGLAVAFIGIMVAASILGFVSSKGLKEQLVKSQVLSESLTQQVQEIQVGRAKLHDMVYFDAITGLRSAHAQRERVRELTEQNTPFALMSLNLDSFRLINDNFGPSFGNAIISAAADVISRAVGTAGELSRAEGAEFTVVAVNLVDQELLKDLSNRILISLRQPLNQGEVNIYSDISIGISRFPIDATDPDELLRMAQLALHQAKARGGHGMCGYEPHMNQIAQNNLWLDHNLRTAVERNQLALHYQPKLLLANQSVTGVEALIRWNHPTRGNIRPDEFIPRAEMTGAIIPIGRWIIASAAEQAAAWVAQGAPIRIAINLSARQLADNELLEHLRHAQTVAHGLLDIELTESCLADNEKATLSFLEQCRSMGFGVHLDDFGTGYSSLARVAQLPLTMIKLDRGFVSAIGSNEKADALLRAMVSICKELDLPMVAEGVETLLQAHYLHALGVGYAQGWLYAPAMAPAKFEQWLASTNAAATPTSTY